MSDLENAAAAHARRQRQAAESEAARHAKAQHAAHNARLLLRKRAQEFFVFARDHGAPLFRRYHAPDPVSINDLTVLKRTDEMCIVAAPFQRYSFAIGHARWAVTADGTTYVWACIRERRHYRRARWQGIRDDVFVTVDPHQGHGSLEAHFVAAAAALLESVSLNPQDPAQKTGIQKDGLIGYQL